MKRQWFYIIFIIPLFTACLESPEMTTGIVNGKEKPTVITQPVNPIPNDGNLLFQGEIIEKGKSEIIERGFYWSPVSNDPGINDNVAIVPDVTTDVFTYELKGVSGKKTFYWRAYARNSFGFDYGEVQSCQTPEIWIEKDSLNAFSRGRGAVFVIGNIIYITCGEGSGHVFANETWSYNIATNRWNQDAPFLGDFRRDPVVFTIENLAFVGTGSRTNAQAYNDFYQFDANSGKWTEIPTPDNFEARYEATAFSLNGKGYVVGGYLANRQNLNDVWQYTYSNTGGFWEQKGNFPADFSGGISIRGNNRVFVGFGDNSESKRILWEYDEKTDSWSEFTTLPDKVQTKIYSGVIIRNTIYIVDKESQIWTLDLSDKTWDKKTDLPHALFYGDGGYQTLLTTGNSNSIYVGLGYNKYLYEYRPLWDN